MTKRKNNPVLAQKAVTKYKRQRTIVLKMLELGKMMDLKLNMFVLDPKSNKLQEIYTDESINLSAINNMMATMMTSSSGQKNSRDKRQLKFESFNAKLKYKWDDEREPEEAKEESAKAKKTNTGKFKQLSDYKESLQTEEKLQNSSFEHSKILSKTLDIPATIGSLPKLIVPTNAPHLDETTHSLQNITFRDIFVDFEQPKMKRQSIDCGQPATNFFGESFFQKEIGVFQQHMGSQCQNNYVWQTQETNIKIKASSKTLQNNFAKRVFPFEESNMLSKTVDIFDQSFDPQPIFKGDYPASLFSITSSYENDDF